jgi:ABC-type multidrug transport system fused ATPase/permease subunit
MLRITGDVLQTHQRSQLELRLGILIIVFFILSSLCGIVLTRAQCRVAANSEADVASRLFRTYLSAPYLQHMQRNSADLNRNVLSVCQDIHQSVLLSLLIIGGNLFTIVILVSVVGAANLLVTIVAVLYFFAVALVYIRVVSPRARTAGRDNLRAAGFALRASQEAFHGLKAFQASGTVGSVVADYQAQRLAMAQFRYRISFYATLPQYYMQSAMIGGVVIFALVIVLSGTGNITAIVGLIVAASIRLMPSLYQILTSMNKVRAGQASVHEIYADLRTSTGRRLRKSSQLPALNSTLQVAPARESYWRFSHSVELANVCFTYPNSLHEALTEVSIEIFKGTSVAFVGRTGAGKTTVVDLLLGMFPPSRGEILVDGTPLRNEVIEQWRAQVAYVPQDIFLIDGTISQNVTFDKGSKGRDSDRVWQALEQAHIAKVVGELPDGIDTIVGERGIRFSGGQRQRLGIARALYRRPAVLILDEATSALDTATESAFAATIDQLRGTLTIITVAHRLSTVRECDNIFLMDDGQVVAEGDFDLLRQKSEIFNEMARLAHIDSVR